MTKTYRFARKSILGYLPFALYFGVPSGAILALFVFVLVGRGVPQDGPLPIAVLLLLGLSAGVGALQPLIFLVLPLMQVLFGYLKISPTGLEYRRWPLATLRCRWEDVEGLQRGTSSVPRRLPFMRRDLKYATLQVRRSKPGREISVGGGTLGSAKYHLISLTELEGWSDGSLLMDLRAHAPHAIQGADSEG